MIKYRLIKEPVEEKIRALGQTKRCVAKYISKNTDENWLNNRINPSRSTLCTAEEVARLAWFLQCDIDEIADEVDPAEYRRGRKAGEPEQPQEITIAPQISEAQWTRLEAAITNAIKQAFTE